MRKMGKEESGTPRPVRDQAGRGGVLSAAALWGALLVGLVAGGGCSRGGEPKTTGSSSAAPVSLQCVWQAGYTYRLRLEMTQTTDLEKPEPDEGSQHLVAFEQECLIKVTEGARGGVLNLDMEILSLGMERANGGKKALSFDSEQGGETLDEMGYIPVLRKLIGGRLRFQVSSNGNVLRADGVSPWLERALRNTNTVAANRSLPEDPAGADPASTPPAPLKVVRLGGRNLTNAIVSMSGGGSKVGSTLRSLFTQDHFKQMLEFPFLPPNPVRIGDLWSARGETPITTRGRFRYDATCKFEGWQMHLGTNCARVAVEGNLNGTNTTRARPAGKAKTLRATLWIDTGLQFPVTMIVDKQTWAPPDTSSRLAGTNRVVTLLPLKIVHQRVATTLLSAAPSETAPAAGESQVK